MNFQIYNIICAMFATFVYISFRFGINSYLRVNKNSKTYIKKSKKGCLNYWIYKKINDEVGLGYVYYLNIFLFILTFLYLFLSVCLGWIKVLFIPIAICNSVLCIVQIPAIIFSDKYWNLDYYNKKFVVLAKSESGRGFHSSFYAIIEILGILMFAVYNVFLTINVT